jgi:hypothetical protein
MEEKKCGPDGPLKKKGNIINSKIGEGQDYARTGHAGMSLHLKLGRG